MLYMVNLIFFVWEEYMISLQISQGPFARVVIWSKAGKSKVQRACGKGAASAQLFGTDESWQGSGPDWQGLLLTSTQIQFLIYKILESFDETKDKAPFLWHSLVHFLPF